MQPLNIRITQRREIDGKIAEDTIELDTGTQPQQLGELVSSSIQQFAPAEPIERFTRVFETVGATAHVAVIDHATGLMWSVESLGDPADPDDGISQEHCAERCKQLRLLGHDDWRLPTRAELAGLVDDTRHEPAIDTTLFPEVKPRWHWTSTAAAWSSASAWGVHFDDGNVGGYLRGYDGFALAVRRAGQ